MIDIPGYTFDPIRNRYFKDKKDKNVTIDNRRRSREKNQKSKKSKPISIIRNIKAHFKLNKKEQEWTLKNSIMINNLEQREMNTMAIKKNSSFSLLLLPFLFPLGEQVVYSNCSINWIGSFGIMHEPKELLLVNSPHSRYFFHNLVMEQEGCESISYSLASCWRHLGLVQVRGGSTYLINVNEMSIQLLDWRSDIYQSNNNINNTNENNNYDDNDNNDHLYCATIENQIYIINLGERIVIGHIHCPSDKLVIRLDKENGRGEEDSFYFATCCQMLSEELVLVGCRGGHLILYKINIRDKLIISKIIVKYNQEFVAKRIWKVMREFVIIQTFKNQIIMTRLDDLCIKWEITEKNQAALVGIDSERDLLYYASEKSNIAHGINLKRLNDQAILYLFPKEIVDISMRYYDNSNNSDSIMTFQIRASDG